MIDGVVIDDCFYVDETGVDFFLVTVQFFQGEFIEQLPVCYVGDVRICEQVNDALPSCFQVCIKTNENHSWVCLVYVLLGRIAFYQDRGYRAVVGLVFDGLVYLVLSLVIVNQCECLNGVIGEL